MQVSAATASHASVLLPTIFALCLLSVVCTKSSAAESAPTNRQTLLSTLPEPSDLVQRRLPDPGPRYERLQDLPEWGRFERAVQLYGQGQPVEARLAFQPLLREYPRSKLLTAVRVFLGEIALASGQSDVRPMEIVEQYKALMREESRSLNAKRAGWRVGDIYRMEGWYQESQVAYQHALSQVESDSYDAGRAMLGLGYAFQGAGQWKDSERTFETVLKRTTDASLAVAASLGQAHSLYRQGRMKDADAVFDMIAARWPAELRKDPYALLRYADTAGDAHRLSVMREQLLHFYNLYPVRPENPTVLGRIADSYRETGNWEEAKLFYSALLTQYPDAPVAATARIRYADVQEHRDPEDGIVNLRQTVTAHLSNLQLEPGETVSPRRLFQESVKQYEDSSVGSEALFHLGEAFERIGKQDEALAAYEQGVMRTGRFDDDPWPAKCGARLKIFLQPRMETAWNAGDDFELVNLFHRHGPKADRLYAGTKLLLEVADAHQRVGFPVKAAKLYQNLIRDQKAESFHEEALIGLGQSYLEQKDPHAAKSVFERYRLQYPTGKFTGEALMGLFTALRREGNVAGLIRIGRQWLQHHPRHRDRAIVQLKLADALSATKQYTEAALLFDAAAKEGAKMTATELMHYGDALAYAKRSEPALALYKQALIAGPSADQTIWIQFQIVRLAKETKRQDLARGGLRVLGEHTDSLVQRMAGVLQADVPQVQVGQGGRR
ncbi:tetratricopeptide repeat protein [Nitrospirales bacterium NOB]|nr:MAG: Outer membrane protein assembly factor BamD [Nitrospira sp. OLB3]MBV6470535.1 Outer membrane protein assembly factor BamD [Nitrospirota bacterium]MCE7965691.1 hypothetical protein [Nitrospira sp. NTP2]MDL1890753.1 tetratricopeptide repeat protein [Nitrospirales bacterium NOB]RIK59033.1 MAG: hypothetical protein DCC63_08835 [Nitrospira sp.]